MMMHLMCFPCLVSESKIVRVTQVSPAVFKGLCEKKGIPCVRGWREAATVQYMIIITLVSLKLQAEDNRKLSRIISQVSCTEC